MFQLTFKDIEESVNLNWSSHEDNKPLEGSLCNIGVKLLASGYIEAGEKLLQVSNHLNPTYHTSAYNLYAINFSRALEYLKLAVEGISFNKESNEKQPEIVEEWKNKLKILKSLSGECTQA